MLSYALDILKLAHKHSNRHRDEVLNSEKCSCFHCENVFEPRAIEEWWDEGQTAECPNCGIDSVIGDRSGYPVACPEFLAAMRKYWF